LSCGLPLGEQGACQSKEGFREFESVEVSKGDEADFDVFDVFDVFDAWGGRRRAGMVAAG